MIVITRPDLPGDPARAVPRTHAVRAWTEDDPPRPDQLRHLVRDAHGILCLGTDVIDHALLRAAGDRLQVVALASMGYDAVDLVAAADAGIVVTHTPSVLAETTADLAFALLLAARRRLVDATDDMRAGGWSVFRMNGYLGLDVHGQVLGLLGYGQIGRAVARRASGFGMTIQHHDRTPGRPDELSQWVDLDTLIRTSDVISIHVPLTAQTRHLVDAGFLARMKPTATLVNTSRGGVVDEQALAAALRAGQLHSAGLDVMEHEPRHDPADPLFHVPGLVVLPHIGSATQDTRTRMVELAVRNITEVLAGRPAPTPIPGTAATPTRAATGRP